jgi:hypothetical protein
MYLKQIKVELQDNIFHDWIPFLGHDHAFLAKEKYTN